MINRPNYGCEKVNIQARVKRKRGIKIGKGFSREELKEIGLSLKQALKLKIPVDVRRSTKHKENVNGLKKYLEINLEKVISKGKKEKKVKSSKIVLELDKVRGIGPKLSKKLKKIGVQDANTLSISSSVKIGKALGFSEEKASIFIKNAKSLIKDEKKKHAGKMKKKK
jgi:ribosomal protein L13E